MYAKELNIIIKSLKAAQDALLISADPSADIQRALKTAKDLKTLCVGVADTIYVYDCTQAECNKKCHIEPNCMLSDLTFCLDSLQSGDAQFTLTATK